MILRKSHFYLYICGLILLAAFGYFKSSIQPSGTTQISLQDHDCLCQFFYRILYKEGLIYVLSGSKPMGTACYTSSLIPEADSVPINQVLKEGWKTWSKYQRYFPKKKMIFRIIGSEENDCTIKILLIHKEHFRNIVFKHQKLFESVLGQKIDITKMLKSFEHDEDPIRTVLKNNHLLLGILYGFGVHNSQRFLARWEEVEKLRSCHKFRSQREMYESIGNELTSTLENENHPILNLPVFSVDPLDEETRELRIQYEREREDILKKWTGRDLLEIAMKEWK